MTITPEFLKAVSDRLSSIKNQKNNTQNQASPAAQKSTPSTTPKDNTTSTTPKDNTSSGNTPMPGTPNTFENKSSQKTGDFVGEENSNKGEMDNKNQEVQDQENQELQVDDDWLSRAASQLVEVETQQAHCVIGEPPKPFSRIKRETPLPLVNVVTFAAVATIPYIQRVLRNLKIKQEKEKEEETVSFFVITYLFTRTIEFGQYVVATDSCDILNDEFDLNPKIEQYMIGEIIGIIDESIYQVMIQVFPNKRFVYKKDFTFITFFVDIEEVSNYLDRPTSPSYKLNTPSRRLIERYYVKIKKSKYFRNLLFFLKDELFSSKR